MATETTNFGLTKDAPTDYYNINTTNANLDKIDAQMKKNADSPLVHDSKNNTVTFTEAEIEANINSGEKHSVLFGKILKSIKTIKATLTNKVDSDRVKTDVPSDAKFTDTIYNHPSTHPASMITGLPTKLPADGGDADTVGGYTVKSNVPAGAKFTDTIYTHPANHPPSIIAQNTTNRFVTDTEKANWNSKAAGSHTHSDKANLASPTFTGTPKGTANTSYTTSQFRNIKFGTTEPSSLANGEIYFMYE